MTWGSGAVVAMSPAGASQAFDSVTGSGGPGVGTSSAAAVRLERARATAPAPAPRHAAFRATPTAMP